MSSTAFPTRRSSELVEKGAEVLHAGEERSQLGPFVSTDLLREHESAGFENSVDFVGIHLFVSIDDEVEHSVLKREVKAGTVDHLDAQRGQSSFGDGAFTFHGSDATARPRYPLHSPAKSSPAPVPMSSARVARASSSRARPS